MTEHLERLSPVLPADPELWWEETAHLWRYYYAAARLKGLGIEYVADAACGTGYGAEILMQAQAARYVYGFDTIETIGAKRSCRPPFQFGVDLDTPDGRTAVVSGSIVDTAALVSLETLEHLRDPWVFLREVGPSFRHLICSVPIVPNSNPYNPFHRHDFTLASFRQLVEGAGFVIRDEHLQSSPCRINLYAVIHGERGT